MKKIEKADLRYVVEVGVGGEKGAAVFERYGGNQNVTRWQGDPLSSQIEEEIAGQQPRRIGHRQHRERLSDLFDQVGILPGRGALEQFIHYRPRDENGTATEKA